MNLPLAIRLICVLLLVSGCVTAVNPSNADFYYQAGLEAEFAGNWQLAYRNYYRALVNAGNAGASQEYMSAVIYNLGRMTGYTCEFAEAETLLLQALTLEVGLPAPNPGNITKRWSELGRLNFDQGKFQESADWFALAVPELERLGMPSDDPVGFADYLDNFAMAQYKSGNPEKASVIRTRATSIRASTEQTTAKFKPVYYRDVCGGK